MAFERDRAFETDENGIILENGVWITSGENEPTHTAIQGDRYYQKDGTRWRYNDSQWQKLPENFDPTEILHFKNAAGNNLTQFDPLLNISIISGPIPVYDLNGELTREGS